VFIGIFVIHMLRVVVLSTRKKVEGCGIVILFYDILDILFVNLIFITFLYVKLQF